MSTADQNGLGSSPGETAAGEIGEERLDWERRIGRRSTRRSLSPSPIFEAPAGLLATTGVGQVTLNWSETPGAGGYLLYRAEGSEENFTAIDHGGSDVTAVPWGPYSDTAVKPGVEYRYAVAATAAPDAKPGPMSASVSATASGAASGESEESPPPSVTVSVRAELVTALIDKIWHLTGSERLAQLRFGDNGHGNLIGPEFAAALVQARKELGVTYVRSHGIFHDELGVVHRSASGECKFDFSQVTEVIDALLATGVKPVIELSFMPKDMARAPQDTVFEWHGIVSPPKDWAEWGELNGKLAAHLVDHYGLETVASWAFEVWNEANLEVFWTGTREEYFRLYEEAALAIKAVDERLQVGGPATAATEWIEAFVAYVAERELPLDFLSTHTYGNLPLDLRPVLERHGLGDVAVWWTEWGVGSTHFGDVHDTAYGAPFVLRGLKASQNRVAALAYWVVSDHFEELGKPPRLFHNGFGLLSVGNLRKPRYWAALMAAELGEQQLDCALSGDGARSLVDAWAAKKSDGQIDILIWNGSPNASQFAGVSHLERCVTLDVSGLADGRYEVWLGRIDQEHSNIVSHLSSDVAWPDDAQWQELRKADRLDQERLSDVTGGFMSLDTALPMPGVMRLRLVPVEEPAYETQQENKRTPTDERSLHMKRNKRINAHPQTKEACI